MGTEGEVCGKIELLMCVGISGGDGQVPSLSQHTHTPGAFLRPGSSCLGLWEQKHCDSNMSAVGR